MHSMTPRSLTVSELAVNKLFTSVPEEGTSCVKCTSRLESEVLEETGSFGGKTLVLEGKH